MVEHCLIVMAHHFNDIKIKELASQLLTMYVVKVGLMTTVTSKLQNILTSSSFAFPTSYCLARVSYFLYICFFRACCSSVHTWYVHTSIYCGYNHRIFLLLFRIIQNCWFN